MNKLEELRKRIEGNYNTGDEWDEYLSLGKKKYKSKLKNTNIRTKFYAGVKI